MSSSLYKITAYHCPSCGGTTNPDKKYCDYCGRELKDHRYFVDRIPKIRLLVDCEKDYVNFNDIANFQMEHKYNSYSCCDVNGRFHNARDYLMTIIEMRVPFSLRAKELSGKIPYDICNTRIEIIKGKSSIAYETKAYFSKKESEFMYIVNDDIYESSNITLITDSGMEIYDSAIPQRIIEEMRCPNCAAPIRSRLCACDYCGGWNEVEW